MISSTLTEAIEPTWESLQASADGVGFWRHSIDRARSWSARCRSLGCNVCG